ncbi:Protein TIC 22-like chloroplastic [Euphorbia peplus]|nr:Protein TIC 22-like chloroplastic [Euphorbia peplus]
MNDKEKKPELAQLNLHRALRDLHNNCSSFFQHLSHHSPFQPSLFNLQNHTKHLLGATLSQFPISSSKTPFWARIAKPTFESTTVIPTETLEERLAGVPVYALSNSSEEFVLVTGAKTGKSLGLLCFNKEDAHVLLHQMKSMDPGMRKSGSKVVPLALAKVFQLKVNDVAFRFIPEPSQIKNAVQERKKAGFSDDFFSGVPVFQSRSLVLKSQNKSYRPVFFRKEDLEKSLMRASTQQKKFNPALKQGDIQVAVFEDILKSMKESSTSAWADVVFIPPGFDISTDPADLQ